MGFFEALGLGPKPPDDNTVFFEVFPREQPAGEPELLALRALCMQQARALLKEYIWQKEAFELTPSTSQPQPWARTHGQLKRKQVKKHADSSEESPSCSPQATCLWGSLCWGENVEDEWFVVYLLLEMTKHIKGLVARVWDNDDEFLLIEAAYNLPKWLKPESAANRVWLKDGMLHIVPLPSTKQPSLPPIPSTLQALQVLAADFVPTAAPKVHAAIAARLENYPGTALATGCHRFKAILPTRLASALKANPQLVSSAVDAFYFRDGDDMKAAARMRHFPPSEPRTIALICTNRCQYAQLAQQPFAPPRGWRLPPPGHPDLPCAERGLKITAGFEILMARSARVSKVAAAEQQSLQATTMDRLTTEKDEPAALQQSTPAPTTSKEAAASAYVHVHNQAGFNADSDGVQPAEVTEAQLQCLPTWGPYKGSLERLGYFQGQLPGSSRYKELMAAAIKDFMASPVFTKGKAAALGPAEVLQQLLASQSQEAEQQGGTGQGTQQQGRAEEEVEDSDSWMEAQGQVVEQELAKRQAEMEAGPQKKKKSTRAPLTEQETNIDAVEVAERIRGFVDAMSGLEGAEVCELPHSDSEVSFDPLAFARELERVLGVPFGGQQHAAAGAPGSDKQQLGAGLGGAEEDEEDDWEESTEEGSSFFSDDSETGLYTEDEDGDASEEEGTEQEQQHTASLAGMQGGLQPAYFAADSQADIRHSNKKGVQRARSAAESQQDLHQDHAAGPSNYNSSKLQQDGSNAAGGQMEPRVHRKGEGVNDPCGSRLGAGGHAATSAGPHQPPLPPRLQRLQDLWEVHTATDSDDDWQGSGEVDDDKDALSIGGHSSRGSGGATDDDEKGFMDAYEAELEAQLQGTTLDASFERRTTLHSKDSTNRAAGSSKLSTSRAALREGGREQQGAGSSHEQGRMGVKVGMGVSEEGLGEEEGLQPVDLDLNLVRNLMRSVASQQGCAGPGTNLASLLGLELPQNLQADGEEEAR